MKVLPVLLVLLSGMTTADSAQTKGNEGSTKTIDSSAIDPALRPYVVEPPHITCITQDYDGPFQSARYLNKCAAAYHITVVFGNIDDVVQFDLAPGEKKTSNLNIMDYRNRHGSSWYVCPKGYSAADARGQYFKRPVAVYLCRQAGS